MTTPEQVEKAAAMIEKQQKLITLLIEALTQIVINKDEADSKPLAINALAKCNDIILGRQS